MKPKYRKLTAVWHILYAIVPSSICNLAPVTKEYETLLNSLVKDHGLSVALKYLKALANEGKRFALNIPVNPSVYPFWVQTNKFGLPRRIPRITKLLRSRRIHKLFGLTILYSYLCLHSKLELDFGSIITGFLGERSYLNGGRDFNWFIQRALKPLRRFKVRRPKDLFLTKKGPYHNPSIMEASITAKALLQPTVKPLFHKMCDVYKWSGGNIEDFVSRIARLSTKADPDFDHFPASGRVSPIPDRGGKTRMVTSPIYWVQVVLYPIHDLLMRCLKSLKTDYTYRQEDAIDIIQKWMREGRRVHSIDLKSATDRFPLLLQKNVLSSLIQNEDVSQSWFHIMRWPVRILDKYVEYFGVGQPMGMYSSFAAFSLSHHMVVRYCAWKSIRRFHFDLYCILGDDVVIADDKVAQYYINFMVNKLGVEISETKSLCSTEDNLVAEFAKQILHNGSLLTPLAPDRLCVLREGSWYLIKELVTFLIDRWRFKAGYQLQPQSIVKGLYRNDRPRARRLLSSPAMSHLYPSLVKDWVDKHWLGEYGPDSYPSYLLCVDGVLQLRLKTIIRESDQLLERYIFPLFGTDKFDASLLGDFQVLTDEESLFEKFRQLGQLFDHPLTRFSVRLGWKCARLLDAPFGTKQDSNVVSQLYVEFCWLKDLLKGKTLFFDKRLEMDKEKGRRLFKIERQFNGDVKALLEPYYDV